MLPQESGARFQKVLKSKAELKHGNTMVAKVISGLKLFSRLKLSLKPGPGLPASTSVIQKDLWTCILFLFHNG